MKTPIYQRQYSWEIRQLEDLWNDLAYLEPSRRYYFGSVLLKNAGPGEIEESSVSSSAESLYEVIDGQQRIASVLILLRAILDELKNTEFANQREIEKYEQSYLMSRDRGLSPKLELLGVDNHIFTSLLFESEEPISPPSTASQKRLVIAKRFFREKLLEQKRIQNSESSFVEFLHEIMKKALGLEVMKHVVESDEEAVLMFETVNDRGLSLSSLDKTKSFLMHYLYLSGGTPSNISRLNEIFASIFLNLERTEERLRGQIRSPKDFESDIQRVHYIIFRAGSTYFSDAFSSLKNELGAMYRSNVARKDCASYVMNYAESLGKAFSAISNMMLYRQKDAELTTWLDRVFGLSYNLALPLLVSGWMTLFDEEKNTRDELIALLQNIECLEFRYSSFRSRRSYTLSERLNTKAHDLYNRREDLQSVLSSLQYLIKRYASDGAFKADLESENFYFGSKAAMKVLFYEYEAALRARAGKTMDDITLPAWMSDSYQIDHIWAQAALSEGSDYQEYLRCGNKLGNLAVAPRQLNISLANANFSRKKEACRESTFASLKELTGFSEWREKQINERTAKIASFALERWVIPKLFLIANPPGKVPQRVTS